MIATPHRLLVAIPAAAVFTLPSAAAAQGASVGAINSGDTAWMLTATALVLFMMIPGLSLFYAGLVKARNVLSILVQCYALTCVMSLLWFVCGYSLCFSGSGGVVGNLDLAFLSGLAPDSPPRADAPTIPVILHFAYQMMFFLITPGLFLGAFAERMKFSAILIFSVVWSLLVYIPCCYGVWNTMNFFGLTGVVDLAGGIVVHITAGVAALVACIVVGPRRGWPDTPFIPHNLPFTVAGAGMLWVGWFGFNGGSQLAANGNTAMTVVVTHLSACAAAVAWMSIEWGRIGKPSALGIATGSIAGLAAITPAAGKVGPLGAILIGAVSGVLCWVACSKLKARYGYDDSLDVFGVHGIGGLTGTIMVAIVGSKAFPGGLGDYAIGAQLLTQTLAVIYTAILSASVSLVVLMTIERTIGLRVGAEHESEGLDLSDHGEKAYG
ncbi:MAG: ammonium transporter [Deltaproteobacteria bacterium]|nr:ammonium transporter [Deltaproteobacteria bacterium]